MTKILDFLKKILGMTVQYGALVNTAVKQVEAEVGATVDGATKKQIALTYVLAAAHAGESIPVGSVQMVSGLIDTAVQVLNQLGVFKTKTTTPAPLPPAPAL
jgi:hypothetical protein